MSRAEFARENDHVMDYYQVLNVPRTATSAQIRSAYKKLAKEFHPDAKPGDKAASEKFKQATEAYEVLGDADKRKLYDQYGENWQHGPEYEQQARQQQYRQQGTYGGGQSSGFEGYGDADFSDFFQSMFGQKGGSARSAGQAKYRGQDYNAELKLTLKDVSESQKQTLAQ